MIEPHWRRIGGIHTLKDGQISIVWLAHDPDNDVIHVYDACHFKREVLAVIAEGINARGRNIPIAWIDESLSEKLDDRGCNMNVDPAEDTDAMAELTSREIWERMRSGRFKVDRRLSEWLDEFKTFNRQDSKVPRDTHPLMAATRHAIACLEDARAERSWKNKVKTYPDVAIV